MDPVVTPLLLGVLGSLAQDLVSDACKDHLKEKLQDVFTKAEQLGGKDDLELAYESAMQQAYEICCETLLQNIKIFGVSKAKLRDYQSSLKKFIKDRDVADELFAAIKDPKNEAVPSADVLQNRWQALGCEALPNEQLWAFTVLAYRAQAQQQTLLDEQLREILNAQNIDRLLEELLRQGGVKIQVRRDKYSQRLRLKYSPVDLANLMPSYAEAPQMVIQNVFVPQTVRENPPPVEVPKDLSDRLREAKAAGDTEEVENLINAQQREKLHLSYVSQSPKPVLDAIAAPENRLVVLTGEPGSGKSTLMRYLLTGVIEPPTDLLGEPLPWTKPFLDAFPLLIELRDFYAQQQRGECDDFLEYVGYMGKTDQWFLDAHAVDDYLQKGPALVMFDGLDEIFDGGDRDRIMHNIVGFAQRYPQARIVVTSRPVGYREQVLRNGGFKHFGIQDLDDDQIQSFIKGWFTLTFPQQPQEREQRIERVLGSITQSKSIRLLAGNPMLLTIMALLAREQELPRERAKFYEKAVEVLCHHWDVNRNLELADDYLNVDDKKALLRRVAIRMQAGKGGLQGNFIVEDDLEEEIQGFLLDEQWQSDVAEAKRAARRIIQQLRERNYILCLRGPQLYGFVHRTFLEYLTAAEYVLRFDRQPQRMTFEQLRDLFDQHCRDEAWREVLRLICGQIDEEYVGEIVEFLATRTDLEKWDGKTPLKELPLAVWGLSELRSNSKVQKAGDSLLEAIISLFFAPNTRLEKDFHEDLLSATRELGLLWPGKRNIIHTIELPSEEYWHHDYWPRFIAIVLEAKKVVEELALCTQWGVRRGSIEALVDIWPDQQTRTFLEQRAVDDPHHNPRITALRLLAEKWEDQQTRTFLEQRAVDDPHKSLRSTALKSLVEKWEDEQTRTLLEQRAVDDPHEDPRRFALQSLAQKWEDEQTRTFLEQRAVDDPHEDLRSTVLEALAEKWEDKRTQQLIQKCSSRVGFAATKLGAQHSRFAELVFTRDLDGIAPYLDPTKPISPDHIQKAAEEANIPPDQIDATVRSLSEHMGWDITKGSATSEETENEQD